MPSEKELMNLLGVARPTVRRAIAYLRDQAAIRTVAGRGAMSPNADLDWRSYASPAPPGTW